MTMFREKKEKSLDVNNKVLRSVGELAKKDEGLSSSIKLTIAQALAHIGEKTALDQVVKDYQLDYKGTKGEHEDAYNKIIDYCTADRSAEKVYEELQDRLYVSPAP